MPDWNKAWTITDFGDVIGTLQNIKNTDPLSLPRKGSRKSGKLFEHIVSMDNLFFLKNDTLPLHEKAYRIQPCIHIQNAFCNIFGISITQAMLDLAYQINESDDREDIRMQRGYPAIQRNKFWFDQTTADNIKEKMRMVIDSSSSGKINDEYRHLIDII